MTYVRRSANVNLTQLDQNDLPRILLNDDKHVKSVIMFMVKIMILQKHEKGYDFLSYQTLVN